jgi:hypothetical protein
MSPRRSQSHRPPGRTEIERYIAELAELWGWRHHRTCPSLTLAGYADGFPGDVLLREGKLIFLVIATPRGSLTPPIAAWAKELEQVVAVEIFVIQRDDLRPLARALRTPEGGRRR